MAETISAPNSTPPPTPDSSSTSDSSSDSSSASASSQDTLFTLLLGLLVVLALALGSIAINRYSDSHILSPMILAVILGAMLRNFVLCQDEILQPAITFSLKKLLRLAVILLGLRISFSQLLDIGVYGFILVTITLGSTFIFTCWLGRYLGLSRSLSRLVAAGTSICGASAVMATSGVTRSSREDVAYSITVVTLLGTCSLFLYPLVNQLFSLTPEQYGIWCGASIHEVAQVIAASFQVGEISGTAATVSKLSRVVFLIPVMLILGHLDLRRHQLAKTQESCTAEADSTSQALHLRNLPIPWFVMGFLVCAGLNSLEIFSEPLRMGLIKGNQILLTMALAAMGLGIQFKKFRQLGWKPLYLGLVSWTFLSFLSLGLILLLF